jgi:flagellar biosynthesis chaperone FliJ
MLRANLHKRLAEAREEIVRARDNLGILDEQVAYQQQVADEAETRALVAGTPLADREHREAGEDLRRLRRHRDEVGARLAELVAEQDELLERLFDRERR